MMAPFDVFSLIPPERRPLVEVYVEALEVANRSVNLVSRASVDRIRDQHVAHALTLARHRFEPGSTVIDWGTGGGLPAVPLAICFPEVSFVAVDSIAKKIRALEGIIDRVGLSNVSVWHGRAEAYDGRARYAVSRATAPLDRLWSWTRRILDPAATGEGEWPSGLVCLKGGNLDPELRALRRIDASAAVRAFPLAEPFGRPDWDGKMTVLVTPDASVRT